MTKEHRIETRIDVDESARITWTDENGMQKWQRGRCVSLSRSGCQVEVAQKMPERINVMFELVARDARGQASVRYCRPHKLKYRVGLEFVSGQKLKLDLPPQPA